MSKIRHFVIPDCQCKEGVPTDHLKFAGKYAAEKKPDTIICLGDFADMPSLSSYDVGKKSFEGRRYTIDIECAKDCMSTLLAPIREEQARLRRNKEKQWNPRLVMTLGNHEERLNRAVENDPKLDGLISIDDLCYEQVGWEVYDYLKVVVIDGIAYSHFFTSGVMGRPVTSARMLLTKHHMSCIAGHQQGRDIAYGKRADGSALTAIISGSCLAPHHKVLTADLQYVPLREIKVGDTLVSFDEHLGMSSSRSRRFKTGTVKNIRTSVGQMFDVTLSNGKVFRTTADHKWLTKNCMGVTKWLQTNQMRTNTKGLVCNTKVARILPEWDTINTRDAGWLAGMYDGEGSLYVRKTKGGYCKQLAISQSETHNPALVETLINIHAEFGFQLTRTSTEVRDKVTSQFRLKGGQGQIAKLLGSIRPQRLLSKFKPEYLGNTNTMYKEPANTVMSILPVGEQEYVEIEIDAATMVVEGYPHHNCYDHDESYLTPQTNEHWRGVWLLNDIKDGSFDELPISIDYLKERYGFKSR